MDDDRTKQPKRLTKPPPTTGSFNSRMSQGTLTQLRRQPSVSQSQINGINGREVHDYHPTHSSQTSSNSSLERSPNPTASNFSSFAHVEAPTNASPYSSQESWNEISSDGLNNPSYDTSDVLSNLDSAKASGYQNAQRRPGPPPLSHTSPDTRMMSPALRQSASFSVGDRSTDLISPRAETGGITPKRYSDEANGGRNSATWKKKSGFSSFMNSVLGSPRNVKISAPENPVHVTHVGFDNDTGQFTVSKDIPASF